MGEYDISKTTRAELEKVDTYEVDLMTTDGAHSKETYYDNPNASRYYGWYMQDPQLKKSVDALAMWVGGKGYTTESARTKIVLERMTGWGEDSFESVINNLIICKKIYGDAFAEVIRDEDGELLNLKVLDPAYMRIVTDGKGILKRYEQRSKANGKVSKTFQPYEILHLCNDRVADNIHGTSIIKAAEWALEARNEALRDLRVLIHRSKALGALEVDTENQTKINNIISTFRDIIEKGDVLVYPKNMIELKDAALTQIQIQDKISWIRYLENIIYQALGIPKVILGGSEEFTEASSKIAYLTFEQVYSKEQRELEADLWNQIAVRVIFNKPASIKNELLNSEEKNTGQVGIQPNEARASLTRTE